MLVQALGGLGDSFESTLEPLNHENFKRLATHLWKIPSDDTNINQVLWFREIEQITQISKQKICTFFTSFHIVSSNLLNVV